MDAPTGTVALVFSDVEGSTALWDRDPPTMRAALAVHDEVMRRELARHGGYEVKTEGDAFMIAFGSAARAVEFCAAAQAALAAAPWPLRVLGEREAAEVIEDGGVVWRGLRVRMGVHVGEPDCKPSPVTGRMDYFGPMVNRAARVAGLGHGGQVLLSEAARAAGAGAAAVIELGEHALKGLSRAERVSQLVPTGLGVRRFAPLKAVEARRTNLAVTPGFVGRAAERAAIAAALADGERLITLVGPGGSGKSRLARELGAGLADGHAGGAWLCELSGARTLADVIAVGAGVLGVPPPAGAPAAAARDGFGYALAARGPVVLVLDNCEAALAGVVAAAARWHELAPAAIFLATSRERLGLADERVIEVAAMTEADALALLGERATRGGARLAAGDRAALAALAARLDHLPLALELAAARLRVLGPSQLLERLDRGLDVLKGNARDAPGRHASLEAAIAASWELLDAAEQQALVQCTVFHGGFTLDAAETVIGLPDDAPPVLDMVAALRDKSLLGSVRDDGAGVRFVHYQSVFSFARGRGEPGAATRRHAEYYVARGEDLRAGVVGPAAIAHLTALIAEVDNVRAAFERHVATAPALAARAALVLDEILAVRGPAELRATVLERAAAAATTAGDAALLAQVHLARARAARLRGEPSRVEPALVLAEAAAATAGDPALAARIAVERAMVLRSRSDPAAAVAFDAAVAAAEAAGQAAVIALARDGRAALAQDHANLVAAERDVRAALEAARGGDPRVEARIRQNLATILQDGDRLPEAEEHYAAALELARAVGDRRIEGVILANLGNVLGEHGKVGAIAHLDVAVELVAQVGDRRFVGITRIYRALVRARAGELAAAAAELDEVVGLLGPLDARFAAMAQGYRAVVALLGGDAAAAVAHGAVALDGLARAGARHMRAYFAPFVARARERTGDAGAATAWAEARAEIARLDLGWLRGALAAFDHGAPPEARSHALFAARA